MELRTSLLVKVLLACFFSFLFLHPSSGRSEDAPADNYATILPAAADDRAQEAVAGTPAPTETPAENRPENPSEPPSKDEDSPDSAISAQTASSASAGSDGGSIAGSGGGNFLGLPTVTNSVFTGSATLSIPIEVPPGRGGIAPNLALAYRNTQKSSWIGTGWEMDMGAIQRATKFGVNYSGSDFVAIVNGAVAELVSRSGDWGANYYGAKIEGQFSKYEYKVTTTGGWEVTATDGTKYYYGSTSLSRQDNGGQVYRWCLDLIKDRNGNYMKIYYAKDNGEIYLERIEYTFNDNAPPLYYTNYVQFYRELRSDAPDLYVPNFRVQTKYRLRTIEVRANGSLARAYKLSYANNDGLTNGTTTTRSTLTTVQQYGSDAAIDGSGNVTSGTFLTIFNGGYDAGGRGLATPDYYLPALPGLLAGNCPTSGLYTKIGDFNGDAKADYMWMPCDGCSWLVAYGTDTGLTTPSVYSPAIPATLSNGIQTYNHNLGTTGAFMKTGDFNGDGKTDYMWNPGNGDGRWLIAYANELGTGFNMPDYNSPALPAILGYNYYPPYYYFPYYSYNSEAYGAFMITGDFNGDGKTDYMWKPSGGDGRWLIAYANAAGTGFVMPNYNSPALPATLAGGLSTTANSTYNYYMIADFNGDGRMDYMWVPNNGDGRWLVAYSTANGFTIPNYNNPALPATITGGYATINANNNASIRFAADFNGDGKADYMWVPANGDGRWLIAYATGSGSGFTMPVYGTPALPATTNGVYSTALYVNKGTVANFNGDGRSDYMWKPNNGDGRWLIAYSNGNGFITPNYDNPALPALIPPGVLSRDTSLYGGITTADFDGDGKTDYMWEDGNDGRLLIAYANVKDHLPDVLTSAGNAIGGSYTLAYSPSPRFPDARLFISVQVVKSITANDGNGNTSSTLYDYSDGYFDIPQRDFRGFGYVKQTNPDATVTENWYHQDDFRKGLMSQQVQRGAPDQQYPQGKLYTQTDNLYEYTQYSSCSAYGCAFPYLRQTDQWLLDGTPNKDYKVWFDYDFNNGNLKRKYHYGDDAIISGDDKDENILYTNDTANWIVSLPVYKDVKDGFGIYKAKTWFTYETGKVNLLTKMDWLEGGTNPVTSFTYDSSYGNLQTTTDPKGNLTTYTYDATKTYQTAVTNNSFGFTTSKTYDYKYGKPLTETDFNNNTTAYEYDLFGRPTKIIKPYDTSSFPTQTFSYDYFGQGVRTQRITTRSTEQSGVGNNLWQATYFDGLGRTIATRSEGPDNTAPVCEGPDGLGPQCKVIVAETIYNAMGRVSFSSLPYFEGLDQTQWFSYLYDPLGRVTQVTNPAAKSTLTSYSLGTAAIIDANGHKKEEDRDAYGRLKTVREYTGVNDFTLYATTSYAYNALDALVEVRDAANNVTSIDYDTLGRKKWMTDPDMGYWQYTYDANGNLLFQIDAKGQMIFFQYDALNRVTLKNYPAGTDVVYTYDESFTPNHKGRLTTVTDASGATKFYYDMLGRTTTTIKTVNSVDYRTDTTYDAMGRTKSITYPDPIPSNRETVNYTYNTAGSLWQVAGYAAYTGYNAAGKVGTITYNNGVVKSHTYEPTTLRLSTLKTNGPGGSGYTAAPVAYNWATANTPTGVVADDWYATFSLPFAFNFYGTNYTQAHVSSNGFVSFVDGGSLWDYTPDPIPNASQPNALAAGLWRDLYPPAGGCTNSACITYGSTASQFAVSYNNVKNYGNTSRQTFQIVLNSDGSIVYQYAGVTNDVPTGIGVENQTGTVGTPYGNPSNGLAVKFTPNASGIPLQDLAYGYDDVGNIQTITDNLDSTRTQTFTYDELNRLMSAQSPVYGTISYNYDQIGNMIFNSRVGAYDYLTFPFKPHAVSLAGSTSYGYDANGNMTNKNGVTIAYDYDNRPVSIGATTFVYDYAGRRVKKNSTVYIGNLYECTSGSCTKYIFGGSNRLAMKNSGGVNYYHTDHLNSSNIVTNALGAQVEAIHYYPYGETRLNSGSVNVKHKYTGQEEDAETGLYYYGARYYDPSIGRFISADTIVPDPGDPQSLNRYSYALNNPLIYIDPTGHKSEDTSAFSRFMDWFSSIFGVGGGVGANGGADVQTGRAGKLGLGAGRGNGKASNDRPRNEQIHIEGRNVIRNERPGQRRELDQARNARWQTGSDYMKMFASDKGNGRESTGTKSGQAHFTKYSDPRLQFDKGDFAGLIPDVTIGIDSPAGGVNTMLPFSDGGPPVTLQTAPSYNYPLSHGVNLKVSMEVNQIGGGANAVGSITTPIFGLEGSVDLSNGSINNPTLLGPQANFPLGYGTNLYIQIKW